MLVILDDGRRLDIPESKMVEVRGFPVDCKDGYLYYVPCTGMLLWYVDDGKIIPALYDDYWQIVYTK